MNLTADQRKLIPVLGEIIDDTMPTPSESDDWKDHAAKWSARINAALWEISLSGKDRTTLARMARRMGLLDGGDAPREFRNAINGFLSLTW